MAAQPRLRPRITKPPTGESPVNIRQADLAGGRGWIILELVGEDGDIEAGITRAISREVRVGPISDNLTTC